MNRLIDEPINSKVDKINSTVIPALLTISVVSAIGGSLFLFGIFGFFGTGVDDKDVVAKAEAAKLPLQIIEQFTEKQIEDAGGTGSVLNVDENFVDPENHCEFCTRVEYIPGSSAIAGFAYTSDTALDLSGAKKIRFWVMGEEGGEKVKFKVAGKEKDIAHIPNADLLAIFDSETFARTTKEVTLTNEWANYEVGLEGGDLSDITHPFAIELTNGFDEKSEVLYLKGVVVDDEPLRPDNALETIANVSTEPGVLSAEILTNKTSGDTATLFRFSANVTGGEPPYSFQWEFGEGSETRGHAAVHSFDEPGTYNLTLTVIDKVGAQVSTSINIEIVETLGALNQEEQDSTMSGDSTTIATTTETQELRVIVNATLPSVNIIPQRDRLSADVL